MINEDSVYIYPLVAAIMIRILRKASWGQAVEVWFEKKA